jgi:putative PIN family toxin of toxin-antitoxin system
MKSNLRFVFDTNAIVSGLLLPESKPRQAFDRAQDQGSILISIPILTELNEVLSRKKFDKYLPEEKRKRFLAVLAKDAELIEITEEIVDCRDPKDNKFLELAVCGNADCIISGDKDLLELNPFRGIAVLKPDEFLKKY